MRRSVGQPKSGRSKWSSVNGAPPTIEDFDKKLAETDSYLQLLLNQVSGLKAKIDVNGADANSSTDRSENNGDFCAAGDNIEDAARNLRKSRYEDIANKAVGMTESIKHAIVLLQIAKNATIPQTDEVKKFKSGQSSDILSKTDIDGARNQQILINSMHPPNPADLGRVDSIPVHDTSTGVPCEEAKESLERDNHSGDVLSDATIINAMTKPQQGSQITGSHIQHSDKRKSSLKVVQQMIPDESYESDSDSYESAVSDADDFELDAGKYTSNSTELSSTAIVRPHLPLGINSTYSEINSGENYVCDDILSPMTPGFDENDQNIDYDKLYDNVDDDEDLDMKSHGSVITHLLSQVRIGMDLTRIVLPTFILERRSLLEMYSDFFAHPDLFLDIPDGTSPEERIIRALKWYLSSFHAGRKSSIAKKPYNPILGETFRCYWKLPSDKYLSTPITASMGTCRDSKEVAKESALPECGPDELTFIAEQVSHHPPISAFYAEHVNKRISTSAHIYTKSSFLGMSVRLYIKEIVCMPISIIQLYELFNILFYLLTDRST